MEKLIQRIANTQAFMPDDRLGKVVKEFEKDELFEDSLNLVYAARKDNADYNKFIRFAQERDSKRK